MRYMLGGEPNAEPQRASAWSTSRDARPTSPAPDRARRWASTSCSPTCRAEYAQAGAKLLVEYLGERYPVTVAIVGSTPLFDPENERVRS